MKLEPWSAQAIYMVNKVKGLSAWQSYKATRRLRELLSGSEFPDV